MKLELSESKKFLLIRESTEMEYEQLKSSFTKKIEGWRYHPLVKRGVWSGEISFVSGNKIPAGLWSEVKDTMSLFNYKVEIDGIETLFDSEITREDFDAWVTDFFKDSDKYPRDYQIDTAYKILKFRRCIAELATSAGKSLIVFMVLAFLLEKKMVKKVLLIVPNVSLVIQASEDFGEYNHEGRLKMTIQQIYAGVKIKKDSNIVVGTYQSLVKRKAPYFADFDIVIVDETHKVQAASIRTILEKLWHASYRFGVSGTIPKPGTINRLSLMANTGPLITNISASYLQSRGFISECEVKIIQMDYVNDEQKRAFHFLSRTPEDRKKLFVLEQQYIVENEKRLRFVASVINASSNNSLVLFHHIDHGKRLYRELLELRRGNVFYVDGGTPALERDLYKGRMELGTGKILVASFGTFSTGINITNLHNVFLTESFKSEVIIRQSIGRGLRKHEFKDKLVIIDFVDDMRLKVGGGRTWENYLFKHARARLEIYQEQNFPYTIKKIKF